MKYNIPLQILIAISTCVIILLITTTTVSRSDTKLERLLLQQEQLFRETLQKEIDALVVERARITDKLDSLTKNAESNQTKIEEQLKKYYENTNYLVRNYYNASFADLLKRLQSD